MAAVTPAPELPAEQHLVTPWSWVAVVLAPFIALGMTAVASCLIALLAIPVAYGITRDGYVALLAVSYGPYAAAQVLVSVALAATVWLILTLIGHTGAWRRVWVRGGGVLAGGLGLYLASLPLLGLAWRYGPALPFTPGNVIVAALAGGLAAILPPRHRLAPADAPPWRSALWQVSTDVAVFAFVLALLLEGWVALTSLLG